MASHPLYFVRSGWINETYEGLDPGYYNWGNKAGMFWSSTKLSARFYLQIDQTVIYPSWQGGNEMGLSLRFTTPLWKLDEFYEYQ